MFFRQIECIRNDDREAQLRLYAPDCVMEFPFAVDRPRIISGRAEIARVMQPLWEEARLLGAVVAGFQGEVYDVAGDGELVIANFTLAVHVKDKDIAIPFIQFMRVRDGKIIHVREYFEPGARSRVRD
jgi:ketosteroid isomerase-like protein